MNTLQTMQKKLKNKKGFTLMEMLIVVAIVAILVAIAIPTFGGALDKAKKATDQANLRATQAIVAADYLENSKANSVPVTDSQGKDYVMQSSGEYVSGGKSYTYSKGTQLTVGINEKGEIAISGGQESKS